MTHFAWHTSREHDIIQKEAFQACQSAKVAREGTTYGRLLNKELCEVRHQSELTWNKERFFGT